MKELPRKEIIRLSTPITARRIIVPTAQELQTFTHTQTNRPSEINPHATEISWRQYNGRNHMKGTWNL